MKIERRHLDFIIFRRINSFNLAKIINIRFRIKLRRNTSFEFDLLELVKYKESLL